MPPPAPDILLVIPVYREGVRLPGYLEELVGQLSGAAFTTSIQVVDDGSPREEQSALVGLVRERQCGNCHVRAPILLPRNTRKGGAILEGWRSTRAAAFAFVDADGAIPAAEVGRVLALSRQGGFSDAVLLASRAADSGARVRRSWFRRSCSLTFARFATGLLRLRIKDSQCGFKVVPATVIDQVRTQLRGLGFCFDLELLALLQAELPALPFRECPIEWTAKAGGHFSPLRHTPRMVAQVLILRMRLWFRQAFKKRKWPPNRLPAK